jgi:DNA-binding FadR family transcriptional regulator
MNLSDSPTAGPIRRVSAMEAVLAHLRAAIERGEYAVGDKLPAEAGLAGQFEVSRSVVREALRGLQALGLTVSRTGKGTFVVSNRPVENPAFGSYSARDLFEVRRHVEIPAAGYAARRHTSDDLDMLTRLLERMADETDNTAWVALDSLFHITIAQASGNPVFGKVIEEIRDALAKQSAFLNQLGDRRAASDDEHRRIVDAIADGSEDAAADAMTVHLEHVENALTTIVENKSVRPGSAGEEERGFLKP